MPPTFALDEAVVVALGRGVALVVGTANEAREPEICRAWGPSWNEHAGELSALLPLPTAESSLRNLERAPAVAFTFAAPTDYRAFQVKGTCLRIRAPEADEWRRARNHFDAFLAEASRVGLEPRAFAPWFTGEGRLVVASIDSAFRQAPGAKAGLAL